MNNIILSSSRLVKNASRSFVANVLMESRRLSVPQPFVMTSCRAKRVRAQPDSDSSRVAKNLCVLRGDRSTNKYVWMRRNGEELKTVLKLAAERRLRKSRSVSLTAGSFWFVSENSI